jgi:(p)ppGpp synthase/HD superfamily hydrolase
VRKGTDIPYVSHPMAVSALTLENGGSEDAAIGALLHDAAEDSADGAKALAEIEEEFGARVASIVRSCSDCLAVPGKPKPEWRQRKQEYIEHLRTETNGDALLVSLCDKVHNVRSILADHAVIGERVWDRFNAGVDAHIEYHRALAEVISARLPGPLADEYARLVRRLEAIAGPAVTSS